MPPRESGSLRPPPPSAARRLCWPSGGGTVLAASPLSLAPYTGSAVELDVPAGCVALVLDDHRVVGLLLPDRHLVRVTDAAGGAMPGLKHGVRALASRVTLLLLAKDRPLTLAWHPSGALRRTGATRGPAPGGGRASLHIASPVRFYRAFLRRTEDLGEVQLRRVLAALLQTHVDAHDGSTNLRARLRRRMARLGLQLTELTLDAPTPSGADIPVVVGPARAR